MTPFTLAQFITESNRIEGKFHIPGPAEIAMIEGFLARERVTVDDLCFLVSGVIQPGARLRDQRGLDVIVGPHVPPRGGSGIRKTLEEILFACQDPNNKVNWTPWRTHLEYETLHPFTDGNGRSGRLLWLWMMGGIEKVPLGFLHEFYYQTLQETRR